MLTRLRIAWLIAVLGIVAVPAAPALAQSSGDETELAKKTQNPVADLISVPFQSNFNFGVGSKDATVYVLQRTAGDPAPPERGLESHHTDHRADHQPAFALPGSR